MEDVLDVYMRPYDRRRPVVCLDETSVQLVAETRTPLPMAPGQPARYDYEYERNGVANLFMITEPLRGWREVVVGDHRTAIDFAQVIQHLVDVHFSAVEKIVLVMDQLNTHSPGSLYEAFPAAEAKRLANKLEIHHTPKHGSWLNMAEAGSNGAERAHSSVLGPPHSRPGSTRRRGQRLGSRPQRQAVGDRLAIQHR